ncbi:diaminopimelate decarboxylase, partial [Lacrimispora saccharolytica]|nr:diaminopimelate decarboxylase [Lacrimispora saccharolytica]
NQHIGSLFMTGEAFVASIAALFEIAKQFKGLRFVDMCGGFGIPYKKEFDEASLDLKELGQTIDKAPYKFAEEYGEQITLRIEPGRYISAESNVILSTVHSV